MKTREFYEIYIDGDWKEDVDTEEEVDEIFEKWINHKDYLEDELLDLAFEATVSSITVNFAVRKVFE